MKSRLLKLCSIILCTVLLINMLPVQALGAELQESAHAESSQPVLYYQNQMGEPGDAEIVAENIEGRTQFSKEFVMSNGLNMAVIYPEAVHYDDNGQWKDIDNTLKPAGVGANACLTNTAGEWTVSFPRQLSNSNQITVNRKGYTLRFGLAGELRSSSQPGLEIMSAESVQKLETKQANQSQAVIQNLDLSAMRESMAYPETFTDKLFSRLQYSNVFDNTHLIYDLNSTAVKESIVLASYDPNVYGYRYVLQTGTMIPVLDEDGSIALYTPNHQEIVMTMPAPYMVDQAGEVSGDVKVTLEPTNSGYVLTYRMPMQWLASPNRSWPVVLDPVVEAGTSTGNILDHFVTEHYSASNASGSLMCGYYTNYGKMRTFIKFSNIPTLSSGDVLVNATLSLMYLGGTNGTTTIEAHKVNADWSTGSITWANQPGHDTAIEDYAQVGNSGRSYWDITDIARNWYISGNTGVMLKAPDSIETGTTSNWKKFYSVDYSIYANNLWPSLTITYRNASGLESYWDYTANGAGRAGTGYINNYSGNLVWTRTDLGFGGTRMPVSVSHIYNVSEAASNLFGLGYGWRTNYHQRAYQPSGSAYYIWEDGDGTKHYFYPKDDGSGYTDEDGLELNMTVGSSTIKIVDKMGNASHFDAGTGRLHKLENNQQTPSSINITYTDSSGYKIAAIKDGVNRTYNFTYNSSGLLSKISFVGKGSSELSSVSYSYTGSLLTKITDKDGKYSTYAYNSANLITTATDVDGYRLAYTYTSSAPKRVASVTEYQVQDNGSTTLGGSLTLTYSQNQTKFVDHNGNAQIAQFNDFGNTVSIQDGEGRAQYAQYALSSHTDSAGSDRTMKANQLRLSSRLQNTVCSTEFYGSFEGGLVWNPLGNAVTAAPSTEAAYYGSHSMKLTRQTAGTADGVHGNQIIVEAHGWPTLTFSAYVKTGAGASAYLAFGDYNGQVFATSEVLGANSDWTRLEVSYTPVGTAEETYLTPQVLTTTAGTVYVDCVQVEVMPTASRYNLIDNGDFWGEYFLAPIWTKSSGMTERDDVARTNDLAMRHMEYTVLSITGDPGKEKYVSQQIAQSGTAGDSYVLAGWALGNSVPAGINSPNKREFGLKLIFNNTDGTKTEAFASFSPNIPTGKYWQYTATPAVAKKAYSSITVQAVYSYQANTVYFDGLQLFKESFGSSYTYDQQGNLLSVIDLQNSTTSYEYKDNNLTKILENNKAKTKYEYDTHHNVTRAITQKKDSAGNIVDDVTYGFEYDAYGNNTLVKVTGPENTIRTTATYTADHNRMLTSTDDLENVTTYCYNENTNVLEWVQYPNDTAASRTTYTYDSMYRMATASAAVSGGTALTADYTYTDDLLTAIETGSTTYSFAYGDFAQRSSIKIGSRTLASYTYTQDQNRYLDKLTYGNGDTVSYDYDDQGRVIKETFEDGSTVTYSYDNTGALATVTDSVTGRKTTYYYDLIDRMVKYVESGNGYKHSVGYEYDTLNNLTKLVETINGKKHTTSFSYDYENRLTATTYEGLAGGSNVVESVEYDAYGRTYITRVKNNDAFVLGSWFQYTNSNTAGYDTTKLGGVQVSGASGYMLSSYYSYDGNGNITRYNIAGTSDIEWWSLDTGSSTRMGEVYYHYDTANQLVREDNRWLNKTFIWSYDNAGNITSCKEYAFTESSVAVSGTPVATHTYTYGDSAWGDLLTAYDGAARTYDGIGNLLTDGTWTYTWQNGRELAQMYAESADGNSDITIAYTYDANGMRTGKTVTTKTYAVVHTHSYTETVVAPTCTENGYTLHTCACGNSYQDNTVPALGHHFISKNIGVIRYSVCSRCGYNRGEEYPVPDPNPGIPKPPVVGYIDAEDDISPLSDTPDSVSTERVLQSTVVESHSYVYAGNRLVQETITTVTTTNEGSETTTDTLYFTYGAVGPTTVTWNGTTYYYALNAQGDVVGIFDGSGNCVVTYNWDNAWGYNPQPEGSMADTLGTLNPLRYRGYVYDEETELYYLSTRYYDPEICRFINADAYTATGQGLLGNNMFAYCRNSPVSRVDTQGTFDKEAFDIDGDPTGDEKDIKASASTGFVNADITIYRYGGTNPSNLTPRYADVNSGLSFSTEYRSGSAKTTISAINSSGILLARQDGRTHVTVTPTNASMLAWYEAGSNSEWTLTLKSIVEKVK